MSVAKKLLPAVSELFAQLPLRYRDKVTLSYIDDLVYSKSNKSVIGVANSSTPVELIDAVLEKGVCSIVQNTSLNHLNEIILSSKMIENPKEFLDQPINFLRDYTQENNISRQPETICECHFTSIKEKHELMDRLDSILGQHIKSSSLKMSIVGTADELFTNVIFNAPVEGTGKKISRKSDDCRLPEGKKGYMCVAKTEDQLIVSCTDPFGTLNVKSYFERIRSCYTTGLGESINMDNSGGAGIGSFLIFNACMNFYLIVEQGKRTLITCSFPLKLSNSIREAISKNLHVHVIQEDK